MARYATLEQLKGYVEGIDEQEEPAASALLDRVSSLLDVRLGVIWRGIFDVAEEEPSERMLTGTGTDQMVVPPFVPDSIESVVDADGHSIDFSVEMPNKVIRDDGGIFERGLRYTVTARWGWEETPPEITELTLQTAVRLWRGRDESFSGTVGNINRDGSIVERGFPRAVEQTLVDLRAELVALGWARSALQLEAAALATTDTSSSNSTSPFPVSTTVRIRPTW